MEWITPKTDWGVRYNTVDDYDGDWFNCEDYNRIKNNLQYIMLLISELQPPFNIVNLGADKTDTDYPYADEFNKIEDTLDSLRQYTTKANALVIGEKKTFYDNGVFIDYTELNRIENAELLLYEYFEGIIKNARKTMFRAGRQTFLNV